MELHTADTAVFLRADESAPFLLSLGGRGSAAWLNQEPEALINSAVVDGATVKLHWKLDPQSTRATASEVVFVYESQAPHLRLTWQWSAPASYGPLEHRVTIENLDANEVWIPLQRSFQFRFAVGSDAPLETVYVEKGSGRPSSV